MDSKTRRSSILKKVTEEDIIDEGSTKLKRRISFSGKKSIRIFSGEEKTQAWNNSYEESDNAINASGDVEHKSDKLTLLRLGNAVPSTKWAPNIKSNVHHQLRQAQTSEIDKENICIGGENFDQNISGSVPEQQQNIPANAQAHRHSVTSQKSIRNCFATSLYTTMDFINNTHHIDSLHIENSVDVSLHDREHAHPLRSFSIEEFEREVLLNVRRVSLKSSLADMSCRKSLELPTDKALQLKHQPVDSTAYLNNIDLDAKCNKTVYNKENMEESFTKNNKEMTIIGCHTINTEDPVSGKKINGAVQSIKRKTNCKIENMDVSLLGIEQISKAENNSTDYLTSMAVSSHDCYQELVSPMLEKQYKDRKGELNLAKESTDFNEKLKKISLQAESDESGDLENDCSSTKQQNNMCQLTMDSSMVVGNLSHSPAECTSIPKFFLENQSKFNNKSMNCKKDDNLFSQNMDLSIISSVNNEKKVRGSRKTIIYNAESSKLDVSKLNASPSPSDEKESGSTKFSACSRLQQDSSQQQNNKKCHSEFNHESVKLKAEKSKSSQNFDLFSPSTAYLYNENKRGDCRKTIIFDDKSSQLDISKSNKTETTATSEVQMRTEYDEECSKLDFTLVQSSELNDESVKLKADKSKTSQNFDLFSSSTAYLLPENKRRDCRKTIIFEDKSSQLDISKSNKPQSTLSSEIKMPTEYDEECSKLDFTLVQSFELNDESVKLKADKSKSNRNFDLSLSSTAYPSQENKRGDCRKTIIFEGKSSQLNISKSNKTQTTASSEIKMPTEYDDECSKLDITQVQSSELNHTSVKIKADKSKSSHNFELSSSSTVYPSYGNIRTECRKTILFDDKSSQLDISKSNKTQTTASSGIQMPTAYDEEYSKLDFTLVQSSELNNESVKLNANTSKSSQNFDLFSTSSAYLSHANKRGDCCKIIIFDDKPSQLDISKSNKTPPAASSEIKMPTMCDEACSKHDFTQPIASPQVSLKKPETDSNSLVNNYKQGALPKVFVRKVCTPLHKQEAVNDFEMKTFFQQQYINEEKDTKLHCNETTSNSKYGNEISFSNMNAPLSPIDMSSPLFSNELIQASNKKYNFRQLNEELELGKLQIFPKNPKISASNNKKTGFNFKNALISDTLETKCMDLTEPKICWKNTDANEKVTNSNNKTNIKTDTGNNIEELKISTEDIQLNTVPGLNIENNVTKTTKRQPLYYSKNSSINLDTSLTADHLDTQKNSLPNLDKKPKSSSKRQSLLFTEGEDMDLEGVNLDIEENNNSEFGLPNRHTIFCFSKENQIDADHSLLNTNKTIENVNVAKRILSKQCSVVSSLSNDSNVLEDSLNLQLKEMRETINKRNTTIFTNNNNIGFNITPKANSKRQAEASRRLYEGTPHRSVIEFEDLEMKMNSDKSDEFECRLQPELHAKTIDGTGKKRRFTSYNQVEIDLSECEVDINPSYKSEVAKPDAQRKIIFSSQKEAHNAENVERKDRIQSRNTIYESADIVLEESGLKSLAIGDAKDADILFEESRSKSLDIDDAKNASIAFEESGLKSLDNDDVKAADVVLEESELKSVDIHDENDKVRLNGFSAIDMVAETSRKRTTINLTPLHPVAKKRHTQLFTDCSMDGSLNNTSVEEQNIVQQAEELINNEIVEEVNNDSCDDQYAPEISSAGVAIYPNVMVKDLKTSPDRMQSSRIPIHIESAKKTNSILSRFLSPHQPNESNMDHSLETIAIPRRATTFANRKDSFFPSLSVDEIRKSHGNDIQFKPHFEENPITISDVSVFYLSQREKKAPNHNECPNEETQLRESSEDNNIARLKLKRYIDLTCDSPLLSFCLDDIDKTRLSLVETLLDEEDDDEDELIQVEEDKPEALESSANIMASLAQTPAASVRTLRNVSAVCRECKRCQATILNETSSSAADSFVLPKMPPKLDLGLDRLNRLRSKPSIAEVNKYWRRISFNQPALSNDDFVIDRDDYSDAEDGEDDEAGISIKALRDSLKRTNIEIAEQRCKQVTTLPKNFVQSLKMKLSSGGNWIFDYQMQSRNLYQFDHRKINTFSVIISFIEMDSFGYEIEIKNIKLQPSRVPRKNWKPFSYVLDFQLKLEMPFDLRTLCSGSDAENIFQMLNEIDRICVNVEKLGRSFWKVVCMERSSLIRELNTIYVRKTVRSVIDPLGEKSVEEVEFKIEITNLRKLCYRDIVAPPLHLFREDIQYLPVGLDFLFIFLKDPVSHLKN